MKKRPKLTKKISLDDFKNHYWLKAELLNFCKTNEISAVGSKNDLVQRIETFLSTGYKMKPAIKKPITTRDSHQSIKVNTLVRNYKNDAATRRFFIEQIGKHFHFDAYLRQFTNKSNITIG